jgi:hypothetical protein
VTALLIVQVATFLLDVLLRHRPRSIAPPGGGCEAQSFFFSFSFFDWVAGSPPVGV